MKAFSSKPHGSTKAFGQLASVAAGAAAIGITVACPPLGLALGAIFAICDAIFGFSCYFGLQIGGHML